MNLAFSRSVDGRSIHVLDGLLPNPSEYFLALTRAAFTRTETARPGLEEHRHWVTETRMEVLFQQPIYGLTLRAIASTAPVQQSYRAYRAYTNVAYYGDVLFSHVDCLPGQHDLTALWYLCDEWDLAWEGETVFFDQADEIAAAVRPRPGRLVIFDGAIKHVGRPPSRICYKPRYTFAIKLEPVSARSSGGTAA